MLGAGVLGVGVTFAEPAIGALQAVGTDVDCSQSPYLWLLLNGWSFQLVLGCSMGKWSFFGHEGAMCNVHTFRASYAITLG